MAGEPDQPGGDLIAELVLRFREFTAAMDAVNEAVADRLGLNRTDHRCLEIVNRRGPLTAGQLAEAAGITSGAVTAVLDHLEERGLARRERDLLDRRRVLVVDTEAGRSSCSEYYEALLADSQSAFAAFSAPELEFLCGFMSGAVELTAAHAERLAPKPRSERVAG